MGEGHHEWRRIAARRFMNVIPFAAFIPGQEFEKVAPMKS